MRKPSTDQLHNIAVQGPKSRDILKEIVWTPPGAAELEELKWFRFTVGRIGDFDGIPIVVSRTGYTGELGYEVFCHPKDAPAVWDAIWEAGQRSRHDAARARGARHGAHRGGLIFAGYEFDDQIDPFEAGIGFTVGSTRRTTSSARGARRARRASAAQLVGLESKATRRRATATRSRSGGTEWASSRAGRSARSCERTSRSAAWPSRYAELGTEVEIGKLDRHQKRIPAEVVRFPFYDPEKKRPRS